MPGQKSYKEGDIIIVREGFKSKQEQVVEKTASGSKTSNVTMRQYPTYKYSESNKKFAATGQFTEWEDMMTADIKVTHPTLAAANTEVMDVKTTEWGAASVTKDDFINPATGEPRDKLEIARILDPKFPNLSGDALMNQINDMFPKFVGVPEEEIGFKKEERAFAEREAEATRKGDVYGLQQQAGKMGTQMRGAYGGMGGGMRGAIGGQAAMTKGIEQAYDAYGLGMDKAEFAERKGVYGLEKGADQAYEADIAGVLDPDWFTKQASGAKTTDWDTYEPGKGKEGGYVYKDGSGVGNNKNFQEGGRIQELSMQEMIDKKRDELEYARGGTSDTPFIDRLSGLTGISSGNRGETFMDILTQLPDAGGS